EKVEGQLGHAFVEVDPDLCVECDWCITAFKCPPMHYDENGKMAIDPFLCAGCSSCLDAICPVDAFVEKEEV
ncbi:MAG: indolepyruvate oxidoreductase, partial [Campylobacterales bacterium]|nr:indolepyruvate oxidoreductase [Campylobacterales bacterium]